MKSGLLIALFCLGFAFTAQAGQWRVGPGIAFATGISDVTDIYEENYNNTHTTTQVDVQFLLPIGLGVQGTYTWDSGLRVDMGLGPLFIIRDTGTGDVDSGLDYTEVPVNATVGYTFIPSGQVSPYIRAGVSYHFASGDYVQGSSPGLFGAVGLEFMRTRIASVSLEVAFDQSKVEFDRYKRNSFGVVTYSTEKIKTYDTVIGLFVKF